MSYADYAEWTRMERDQGGSCDYNIKSCDKSSDRVTYERISCRAWTDLLLQLLKVTTCNLLDPSVSQDSPPEAYGAGG